MSEIEGQQAKKKQTQYNDNTNNKSSDALWEKLTAPSVGGSSSAVDQGRALLAALSRRNAQRVSTQPGGMVTSRDESWRVTLGLDKAASTAVAAPPRAVSMAATHLSKEAVPADEKPHGQAVKAATGLDKALNTLAKPGTGKPTVLAATRADWDSVKTASAGVVAQELESHLRSGETFVGRQTFLANAAAAEEASLREARTKRAARGAHAAGDDGV